MLFVYYVLVIQLVSLYANSEQFRVKYLSEVSENIVNLNTRKLKVPIGINSPGSMYQRNYVKPMYDIHGLMLIANTENVEHNDE